MESNFGSKTAVVADSGLFVSFALKLAESFGQVKYWTPSVNAFPKSNLTLPGDGLDGITRIVNFWDHTDADLFVFPDVMYSDMQLELVRQGKRVFGSRAGDWLELQRWQTKKFFRSIGLPVGESHLIVGMDELRSFLQKTEGHFWIKTSRYRGDFETFDSGNYDDVKPKLDEIESTLGMKAEIYPFIVERHIAAIIELGFDGHTVMGEFPRIAALALEEKDTGAIGIAKPYEQFPFSLRWINEKIGPELKRCQYCGAFSSEVRMVNEEQLGELHFADESDSVICTRRSELQLLEDGFVPFFTDVCARAASPPSELYIEWFSNWPEIMWHGSEGRLIDPEPIGKFGIEIMLFSGWADKGWQPVRFPEEIRQWIKLRNWCRINGVDCAVPQSFGLPEIGAVSAIDDSLEQAIALALERAKQINGYFIEPKTEAIPKAMNKIQHAQENGLSFMEEPLPTPDEMEALQPVE